MDINARNLGTIIHYPDYEKLKAEVEKLRTELSMLVLEKDELLLVECKNIEMMYMLAIGSLEYKAYQLECQLLRLKRKVELIQAKKNRQEKISAPEIEEALDAEFADYQARMEEKINKVNAAIERSHGQALSYEDAHDLKMLYRSIVKALHPDLHPELSDAKLQLFYNAARAYENGDLDGMRIISAMVGESELPDIMQDGMATLAKEKTRLKDLLKNLRNRIAQIQMEYPYTMKAFVRDPKQVEARKAKLDAAIGQWRDVIASYKARIDEMLG